MSTHAGIAYAVDHPELATQWSKAGNSLVVLGVPNEDTLLDCWEDLRRQAIPLSMFSEPDINDEYTALAAVLTTEEAKPFRRYQLVLRDPTDPRWQRESAMRRCLHSTTEGGDDNND